MNRSASQWRPTQVLLLGRQPIVLAGLRLLLEADRRFSVIQEAGDGSDVSSWPADVILIDVDGGGIDRLASLLTSVHQGGRIMILGTSFDQRMLTLAFQQGVTGAIRKLEPPDILLDALETVAGGEMWLDRAVTAELVSGLSSDAPRLSREARRLELLTGREREVASLVSEGLRNLEIASRLRISEVTVRNHLTSIFRKLQVDGRFQLALYSFRHGRSLPPSRSTPTRSAPSRAGLPRRRKPDC